VAVQLFVLLGLLYAGPQILHLHSPDDRGDVERPNKMILDTMIFNTFVFFQIFNEFNSRVVTNKLNVFEGLHKNWIFGSIVIFTIILQALIVQFGRAFIDTVPLDYDQWLICVGLAFSSLPVGFIGRLIPVEKWFVPKKEASEKTPLLGKEEAAY